MKSRAQISSEASLRPEDETRLMPRALSGLEHAHARLVEQIAGRSRRDRCSRSSASRQRKGALRPRPQRRVLKARIFHRDRSAGGVDERSDRLAQSRKQSASWANSASVSGRSRPHMGMGRMVLRDESAWRESRNLGPLRLLELDQRAVTSRLRRAASGNPDAARRRRARAARRDWRLRSRWRARRRSAGIRRASAKANG